MDHEQVDEFVMSYLKKKGYTGAAKCLEEFFTRKGSEIGNHDDPSSQSAFDPFVSSSIYISPADSRTMLGF